MPKDMAGTVAGMGQFFGKLGLRRPHVAGNSLGGGIALELAAAGLAASATAFSPAGFFTEAERQRAIAILGLMRATTYPPSALLRMALSLPEVRRQAFGQLMTNPNGSPWSGRRRRWRCNATGFARRQGFAPLARRHDRCDDHRLGHRDRICPHAGRARPSDCLGQHVTLEGCGRPNERRPGPCRPGRARPYHRAGAGAPSWAARGATGCPTGGRGPAGDAAGEEEHGEMQMVPR
jgi:pimeloyl-ACP methyl ester carboxylesterase